MKRQLALFLVWVLCLSGCGTQPVQETTEASPTTQAVVDEGLRLQYQKAVEQLKSYLSTNEIQYVENDTVQSKKGNAALVYLKGQFSALGDYEQAGEIAGRFYRDGSLVQEITGKIVDANNRETLVEAEDVWVDNRGRVLGKNNRFYTYNEKGQLLEEREVLGDKVLSITTYHYNDKGQLDTEKYSDNTGVAYEYTYTYDAGGNLVARVGSGENTNYTYTFDKQGRVLTGKSTNVRNESYLFTYDLEGNMLSKTREGEPLESLTRTYDEKKRVITEETLSDKDAVQKTYTYDGDFLTGYTQTLLKNGKVQKTETYTVIYMEKWFFNSVGLELPGN